MLFRQGDPLEADMSDEEEGNDVEAVGPLEEEEFYPESNQWEAEEEEDGGEKVTKAPTAAAAITEKVTVVTFC